MINQLDYLRELNLLSIVVRMLFSLLIGGALGLERERKNRGAGFRTYTLVCIGAATVMMTNQYVADYFQTGDPTRLGAQVISGIGFLGAGTILLTGKSQVRGITTAAGLWTAACCGLAIGIGFYEGALLAAIFIMLVLATLSRVDTYFRSRSKRIDVYVEFTDRKRLREFILFCQAQNYEVRDLEVMNGRSKEKDTPFAATLSVVADRRMLHTLFLSQLQEVEGVEFIEEV